MDAATADEIEAAEVHCGFFNFQTNNVIEAKAYINIGIARGIWVASQLFLSAALVYLASVEAGCIDDDSGSVIEDCDNKIYGFRPSSLISNIAIVCGLFTAIFMPVFGAIIDYTPHRRKIGMASSFFLVAIQMAQIFTLPQTWLVMAILMAVNGCMYDVQILTSYAYLPRIGNIMGETQMTKFTSAFYILQFSSKLILVITVTAASYGFEFDDVQTSHLSQSISVLWMTIQFCIGWNIMPDVEIVNRAQQQQQQQQKRPNLFTEGFVQVWTTAKSVNQYYNKGCKWFFLSVCCSAAAFQTFTILSVVYLDTVLDMDSTEMGTVFIITGISAIPGSNLGQVVTHFTNPNTSLKLSLLTFIIVNVAASFVLTGPENKDYAYIWATFWGISLGWYHPTEKVFFSMCLPKGQDAELSGFYVYCAHILSWSPPLFFTIFNEIGIHMKWGLILLGIPLFTSIILLSCASPWEEILKEASTNTWEFGVDKESSRRTSSKKISKKEKDDDGAVFEDEA